ncbi:MAG: adenylate kinase [Bacteroidales bacterium]|jgi:adenylate kinase|nr:adenylate kinase [Bacteroidales bacterium]
MLNIVLFGAPGAGKGTQATLLADKHELVHLSTGEILRQEIAQGTELGKLAQKKIDRGELVPDDVVIDMIREQIEKYADAKGFIFDGYPRTQAQAKALDQLMEEKGMHISSMVALDVTMDELTDRLLKRGKDSGRVDDQSIDVIKNRIDVYHKKTEPLIEYYQAQEKYHPINGSGPIEDIFNRLHQHVNNCKDNNDLVA